MDAYQIKACDRQPQQIETVRLQVERAQVEIHKILRKTIHIFQNGKQAQELLEKLKNHRLWVVFTDLFKGCQLPIQLWDNNE